MVPERFRGRIHRPHHVEREVFMLDTLKSELFRGDPRLEKTLHSDPHHVVLGDRGEFVSKIQFAVLTLGGGRIGPGELQAQRYGPDTARAVLAYKTLRQIINRAYQRTPDNIVGKMTIRALDNEMVLLEAKERLRPNVQPS
jgi:hypothetical protein